ncbi:MAG: T9SS type A sorting domain-containing protein, partial [Bacteroidota bacterium]
IILHTDDMGVNWTTQESGTTVMLHSLALFDSDSGYAVGETAKIIKALDGGYTWTPQTCPVTSTLFACSLIYPDRAWAVGAGGVILSREGPSGLDEFTKNFQSGYNYPNPFNRCTRIAIRTNLPPNAILSIISSDGKKIIETMLSEKREQYFEFIWDSKELPDGIYFYQLSDQNYTISGRMMKSR